MYHFMNTSEVKLHQNISEFERKKAAFEEYVNKINNSVADQVPVDEPTDDEPVADPDVEDPALAKVDFSTLNPLLWYMPIAVLSILLFP